MAWAMAYGVVAGACRYRAGTHNWTKQARRTSQKRADRAELQGSFPKKTNDAGGWPLILAVPLRQHSEILHYQNFYRFQYEVNNQNIIVGASLMKGHGLVHRWS